MTTITSAEEDKFILKKEKTLVKSLPKLECSTQVLDQPQATYCPAEPVQDFRGGEAHVLHHQRGEELVHKVCGGKVAVIQKPDIVFAHQAAY